MSRPLPAICQAAPIAASAVLEQQALKKAVRVAGKRFTAPPDLYASVQRQMQPKKSYRIVAEGQCACSISGLVGGYCFRLDLSSLNIQRHSFAID